MKKIAGCLIMLGGVVFGCQENEVVQDDLTGNETVNSLQSGSVYDISGTITFKEKKDGSTLAIVKLSGTEGNISHPVHLHLGDISAPGADVAALLNPVTGNTGKSETHLKNFADESPLSYSGLINLNACIKIHLAEAGPERDIILAAGNIGEAAGKDLSSGRLGIGVCKSE
jgi:hypothetical protein